MRAELVGLRAPCGDKASTEASAKSHSLLIFTHPLERGDPSPATWAVLTGNTLRSALGGLWGAQAVASGLEGGQGIRCWNPLSVGLVLAKVRVEDEDGNAYGRER